MQENPGNLEDNEEMAEIIEQIKEERRTEFEETIGGEGHRANNVARAKDLAPKSAKSMSKKKGKTPASVLFT